MEFGLFSALVVVIMINLIVFLFAYFKQSDHFTDITYASCFAILAVWGHSQLYTKDTFHSLLLLMVVLWAVRLGMYLFLRIRKIDVDHRFDKMRPVFKRYMRFWILQGASIWLIALPFIIAYTYEDIQTDYLQAIGFGVWLIGFLIESIADYQKYTFRNNPINKGKFIQTGLWNLVRHPNYLGEMMVWIGIFVYIMPILNGAEWVAILSPVWICTLLLFISGIPYLERGNKEKYGDNEEYMSYVSKTKRLVPGVY